MSYCVNCGVELDKTAGKCPLCNTPILNPACPVDNEAVPPYPREKGSVEPVNRRGLAIFISVVLVAISIACLALNLLLFNDTLWSAYVMGACLMIWVFMVPMMLRKINSLLTIAYDGAVIAVFCLIVAMQFENRDWYLELALPITLLVTVLVMVFAHVLKRFKIPKIGLIAIIFAEIGVLNVGIELLIRFAFERKLYIRWSAVVVVCCMVVVAALITVLKQTKLYEEVKRRFHL